MPSLKEMLKGKKYLAKEDVDPPVTLRISGFEEKEFKSNGHATEKKWLISFEEVDKWLVASDVILKALAKELGGDHTDFWIGERVEVYVDPTVEYDGRTTGGIRVRAAKDVEAINAELQVAAAGSRESVHETDDLQP